MNILEPNVTVWNRWNESGGPRYPHEKVVQFCFRNYPPDRRAGLAALDLGCGGGVHVAFLAREGFRATGVDLSEVGLSNTRRRLAQEGLTAVLAAGSVDTVELAPGSFDVVVCVGVLDAAGPAVAAGAVRGVSRWLRSGGRGLFVFASDEDFRVTGENPYGLHGYTRAEVEGLFAGLFGVVWIDQYLTTYEGGLVRQSDWLVTAHAR